MIDDDQEIPETDDRALMAYGAVAIMLADRAVGAVTLRPEAKTGVDARVPVKRTARFRLIPVEQRHGVVHGRGPEAVAYRWIHRVGRCARVDEQRLAVHRHR